VRRYVLHDIPLTAALNGEVHICTSRAGELGYYTAGQSRHIGPVQTQPVTPPLLFIHSVNAAASSYEVKPLYEHYGRKRRVYALDLPGFGFSERGARPYTPQLYCDAINDFVANVLRGGPVDAVALSLGSEFLAQAAVQKPTFFRTLAFISPTGMSRRDARPRGHDGLLRFLLNPTWSRLLYDTLTSRPSLKYLLSQLQAAPVDRGLLYYAYVTSHRPAAQYAPFAFIAGKLFTPGIFSTYEALTQPALAVYGQSRTSHYDLVDILHDKPNWRVAEFKQCRDLVHFDNLTGVIAQLDGLFARV
jgi:pimeloyl-ACP methyl ester carboxylesterase